MRTNVTTADNTLLEINKLEVWYTPGKKVLKDYTISLKEHEVVGLIGLNGAGKTTFIKALTGLLTSYKAEKISYKGCDINFRDKRFKSDRYAVFSEDNSFQFFTFKEYISYVFQAYKKKLPDLKELIGGFHFEEYTNVLLKDLSMGNRKKAYLITAFALKAELLLLDEPVNGLDFQSTEFLYKLIAGYKQYGTVLFSSHILESITLTSDKVLVLENGQISNTYVGDDINATKIRETLRYDD